MRVFTGRTASMLEAVAVALALALAWATEAPARIYYDPNSTAIRDLETRQLVVVAVVALLLAGLFIGGLVKLLNRFFAKK